MDIESPTQERQAQQMLRPTPAPGSIGCGTVVEQDDQGCLVQTANGVHAALLAASCLLMPGPGDRIAWVADDTGCLYITAVLRRAGGRQAIVELPGDALLRPRHGSLSVQVPDTLGLAAATLNANAGSVSLTGGLVELAVGKLKMAGESVSAVFDRIFSHARQQTRVVEGIDMLNAQTIDHRAQVLASVDARTVAINGQQLVKLRGGQIHMG